MENSRQKTSKIEYTEGSGWNAIPTVAMPRGADHWCSTWG